MERKTIGALLLVQVLFGLLPVAGKIVLQVLSPMSFAMARVIGGAFILFAILPIIVKRPLLIKNEWKPIAVFALFGIFLNQAFFITGLQWTTAVNATLVITTVPVFTYAIAVISGRETIGPKRSIGIVLALLGVFYLVGLSRYEGGVKHMLGDIFVALNCLCFATFLVFSKPYTTRVNPVDLTAWMFALAAIPMIPLGIISGALTEIPQMNLTQGLVLLFILIGPTAITYVLNATALRTVPSSTVAIFIYCQPLIAAFAAHYILGEVISKRIIPAAVLIFAGVFLVARRRQKSAVAAIPAS